MDCLGETGRYGSSSLDASNRTHRLSCRHCRGNPMMSTLRVLYWNTQKVAVNTTLALNHGAEYDVIALQEPHVNPYTASPACPGRGKYFIIYPGSRVVTYIHKRFTAGEWNFETGEDWIRVVLVGGPFTIFISHKHTDRKHHSARYQEPPQHFQPF